MIFHEGNFLWFWSTCFGVGILGESLSLGKIPYVHSVFLHFSPVAIFIAYP